MKKLIIVSEQKSFLKRPISHEAILGQETVFLKYGKDKVDIKYKSFLLKGINKILGKIGLGPICESFSNRRNDDAVYLYIAMHLNYLKSNLYLLKNLQSNGNRIALYVWDCWQPEFDQWQEILDDLKPDYIFFSFKQTWLYFKDRYNCYWIAQSANTEYFKYQDIDKTRKFIQMGRINEELHKKILSYLKKHNLEDNLDNYAYRKVDRQALFPELSDLVKEINRSKYLVCIPKCYENPKRTGNISAMTGRYYEAIACKTMIIGKKPLVFDELFPEDGMIEFADDLSDFDEKIDRYENNDELYQQIVDRNYECFMKNHTWANRFDSMMYILMKEEE